MVVYPEKLNTPKNTGDAYITTCGNNKDYFTTFTPYLQQNGCLAFPAELDSVAESSVVGLYDDCRLLQLKVV